MQPNSIFRFSTEAVAVRDRLAVWREVIGNQYMLLDVEPDEPASLRADMEVHHLPSTLVTFLRSSPMKYTRTRLHAQKDNGDFTFVRMTHDHFRYYDERQEHTFDAGDAALLYNGNSGTIQVPDSEQIMTVRVNGEMLRGAVNDLDDRLMHRVEADNVPLRLAVCYMESVLRNGPLDVTLGHLVNAHFIDLLALSLRPTEDARERAREGAVPAARLAAIRADVIANLGEMQLSANVIAERHGVSERYVHLLFERSGLSFSRFVTDRRLQRAMTMLSDPACAQMRISDMAFTVGFGDLTTFNRAFRRRFGVTPSDVREQARKGSRN